MRKFAWMNSTFVVQKCCKVYWNACCERRCDSMWCVNSDFQCKFAHLKSSWSLLVGVGGWMLGLFIWIGTRSISSNIFVFCSALVHHVFGKVARLCSRCWKLQICCLWKQRIPVYNGLHNNYTQIETVKLPGPNWQICPVYPLAPQVSFRFEILLPLHSS
jgi:hypothetical protein